jgi:MFS family permease
MIEPNESATGDSPSEGQPPPPAQPRASWYLAVILTLTYVVAFIDRQILNLLLEVIKTDLDITDTEASLLIGAAFALLFVIAGVPLGWLADRVNRRNMINVCIVVWTIMTAACGFSVNYTQLFLARMGVGIGEAGFSPAAVSMIGDRYPPAQRGRAFAFFTAAIPIGSGLAMLGGGTLMAAAPWIAHAIAPVTGTLKPWQIVFLMVALPGVVLSVVVATLKEPARPVRPAGGPPPIRIMPYLRANRRLYLPLMIGFSVLPIMGFGFSAWLPALFIRVHGWSVTEIGLAYGSMLLVCGPLGTFLGGFLTDRLMGKGRRDAHLLLMLVILPLLGINNAIAANLPNAWAVLAMYAPGIVLGAAPSAISHAAMVLITPPEVRARLFAVYALVQSVLGLALGPTLIAVLTDYVFVDPLQLGRAMGTVAACAGGGGFLMMLLVRKAYREAVAAKVH